MSVGAARLAAAIALALGIQAAAAEEYEFDASEFEKKRFELGGYVELKQEHLWMRPDSVLYRLNFADEPPRDTLDRTTGTLQLGGKLNFESVVADFLAQSAVAHDQFGTDDYAKLFEGGVRWSPNESLSLDLGKRVRRWGKGYAWNPVAFIERPKDPNDPQLAREGYVMASADWVRSFDGPLAAVGFTPVALPVNEDVNSNFGEPNHVNPAAKLYLLYRDTDIDFVWLGKGSRPARFGFDFSRNLGSQLEVHGEWARILDGQRPVASDTGRLQLERGDYDSWLLGVRYLTESEVTWIAEYYRNGPGYNGDELAEFYRFADAALAPGVPPALSSRVQSLGQTGYTRPNPGRDYVYVRASAKDPFDWLYVTPAITAIVNVDDGSFQVTPEVVYTGFSNIEVRARIVATSGTRYTDFGEKAARSRAEVYLRLYF